MVLFTQVVIIPAVLFVYLFIFNKRSKGTDSAVSRYHCRTLSAKPAWGVQSWDSLWNPPSPAQGVQMRGGDRLEVLPSWAVSPMPSVYTLGWETAEGPVACTWEKSLVSVPAAMQCQGHRLPLELEEAVKGLRLPWRHCSDPFSELISEMEKVLPLWGFFHEEREGSGGGCGDCKQCCHVARQQQKGTYFGRRGLIPQADLCLALTTAIGLSLSK